MTRTHLLLASISGFFLFVLASSWVHFPYLVDEYWYLYAHEVEGVKGLALFEGFVALRPLFAVINLATFESGLIGFPKLLIWVYFLIHAFTLTYLIAWIIDSCPLGQGSSKLRGDSLRLPILAAFVPLILYPSNHEMFFMALNLPYTLGLTFLVFALYARSSWERLGWMALSFASLETYVLPAILLSSLPDVWRALDDRRWKVLFGKLSRHVALFLGAYIVFRLGVALLSVWYPLPSRDWASLIRWETIRWHAKELLQFLWFIHFYKTNWVITAIQIAALGAMAGILLWRRVVRPEKMALLFAVPWLAGFHYLIVPYYAPRAVYGAAEVRNAVVAFLLFHFLVRVRNRMAYLVPLLLILAYGAQLVVVFRIKNSNYAAISRSAAEIEGKVASCLSPCEIEIESPQKGLRRDWMMLPEYHRSFAAWVSHRAAPDKKVTIRIKPE